MTEPDDGSAKDDVASVDEGTSDDGEPSLPASFDRIADRLREGPLLDGLGLGALAFVLAYLVTASYFVLGPASMNPDLSVLQRVRHVGLVLYNAHFVPIVVEGGIDSVASPPAPPIEERNIRYIIGANSEDLVLPAVVWHLTPALVLTAVGSFLATTTDSQRWRTVLVSGVGVALGYVAIALFGTVLFVQHSEEAVSFRPDRLQTLVLCFVYPLVFATVGAVISTATDRAGSALEATSEAQADTEDADDGEAAEDD